MKREYDFLRGKRGPVVPVPRGKTRITIRLDTELLDWFRSQVEAAGGGNYQTLINLALKEYVRETSSEIAEPPAQYGPRRKAGRPHGGKGARVISVGVEKELLSRSEDVARRRGLSRVELIERGLKAVLAAEGKL